MLSPRDMKSEEMARALKTMTGTFPFRTLVWQDSQTNLALPSSLSLLGATGYIKPFTSVERTLFEVEESGKAHKRKLEKWREGGARAR